MAMKSGILFLTCLLLSTSLFAQQERRVWAEGKLTWDEFPERSGQERASQVEFYLGSEQQKERYSDTTIVRMLAIGSINLRESWVDPSQRTEQLLRYHQVQLDLLEIHRRFFQRSLDKAFTYQEAAARHADHWRAFQEEAGRCASATDYGRNLDSLEAWEARTLLLLAVATPPPGKIVFEERSFRYGMNAGTGFGMAVGSLSQSISPGVIVLGLGFEVGHKRSVAYLHGAIGASRVRQDFFLNGNWTAGEGSNTTLIDLTYGYRIMDRFRWELTPFTGIGVAELTTINRGQPDESLRAVDYNLVFGLNADYRLRTHFKLGPRQLGSPQKDELNLRLRLYGTWTSYAAGYEGFVLNVAVGVGIKGRMVEVK